MRTQHQRLPASGPAREALREKGQFWTPQWVAEAMVAYVMGTATDHIFDPAVGSGAFLLAAKEVSKRAGRNIKLLGTEIDQGAIRACLNNGLNSADLSGVRRQDFILESSNQRYSAIVANPPYIRHHRIDAATKESLRFLARCLIGRDLDGRTGYHVFFFLKALSQLARGGRLAFIMPADTCEGVFAPALWGWVLSKYRLDAVVSFRQDATPFPKVDTNALIFMISANNPQEFFSSCDCKSESEELYRWVDAGFPTVRNGALESVERELLEAQDTGLSRPPATKHVGPVLGDFVRVMRGIATGRNEFFFMTREMAIARKLPLELMVRAIGRTRDIDGSEITYELMRQLEEKNRPTYLLSLDERTPFKFAEPVQAYLREGELKHVNAGALIRQRKPWYKMEVRKTPAFLFAYLGRRNVRFIRNSAGVVPLTSFLCVYPRDESAGNINNLWRLLNHDDTLANLSRVAKSYGSGALKVEPRALERTPISDRALIDANFLTQSRPLPQIEMAFA